MENFLLFSIFPVALLCHLLNSTISVNYKFPSPTEYMLPLKYVH